MKVVAAIFATLMLLLPNAVFGVPLLCNEDVASSAAEPISLSAEQVQSFELLKKGFNRSDIRIGVFAIIDSMKEEATALATEPRIDNPAYIEIIEGRIRELIGSAVKARIESVSGIPVSELLKILEGAEHAKEFISDYPRSVTTFNLYLLFQTASIELKSHLGTRPCRLNDEEIFAIHLYTGGGYKVINKLLRSETSAYKMVTVEAIMNHGLGKLRPFVGLVSRGGKLPPSVDADHFEGNDVNYKSFTSASNGKPFGDELAFTIDSSQGRYIAPLSIHPDEEEVLFKSNSKFTVMTRHGREIFLKEK